MRVTVNVNIKIVSYSVYAVYQSRLRITDEGSVPEMRIWSISLIQSDLKWCIHLSRGLFFNHKEEGSLAFVVTISKRSNRYIPV